MTNLHYAACAARLSTAHEAQHGTCSTVQRAHAVLSIVGPSMRLHFQTADSIVMVPYGHDSVPVEPSPILMVLP